MKKLFAYVRILRPLNVVIAFISVWLILWISGAGDDAGLRWKGFLAACCAALICGGSNVINDYFDVAIDRINKPDRVLVVGLIRLREALIYWAVISSAGVLLNIGINVVCFGIAIFAMAALYMYSAYLKRTALWGNLTVAFFAALAFLYAGLAVDKVERAWFPALFTFVFQFGRELLKDVEDTEGDRILGARTFPIRFGISRSLNVVTASFVALTVLTVYAYLSGAYSSWYLILVALGLYPVLTFTMIRMRQDPSPRQLNRLNHWLKFSMFIGLAAIYAGSQ